ncbi:MAG: MoxR family ATPase [Nitriliruptoraceae bacterium]
MTKIDDVLAGLADQRYLADRGIASAVQLAIELPRPLLLEGDAGVGKTELAKAIAAMRGARPIRLQCHDGIDRSEALYAWDYPRQLLHLRAGEISGQASGTTALYSDQFLLARPLLEAVRQGSKAVLLIDEIDRADDEFEAFLLEILSDFQVTIPELGTITADAPPVVILTSNRTRELSDALRRRCLYHWIGHPDHQREVAIICLRAPDVPAVVAEHVASLIRNLRELDLYKPPGVAESIDWARVLTARNGDPQLWTPADLIETLGVVIKDHDDQMAAAARLAQLIEDAG